jgi:GDSL-like Lipase/Acylhydrolase
MPLNFKYQIHWSALRRWLSYLAAPCLKHWREVGLLVTSVLLSYSLLDAGYRVYQYVTLPDRLFAEIARQASTTGTPYVYDVHTGYRYPPNVSGERGHPWFSKWRTNSYGHVSRFEYPTEKPSNEYRIAVIGDSFTANITNNVRWPELLEEHLNASPNWTKALQGRFTRVINFGVDGFGFLHFAAMLRHQALAFQPDLVIVNFIGDDIRRRFVYPNVPDSSVDRDQRIRAFVKANFLEGINWLRLRPELLIATVGDHFGAKPELPLDHRVHIATAPRTRFASRKEAAAASAAAVKSMVRDFPGVLFVQCPEYWELAGYVDPDSQRLVNELKAAAPEFSVLTMAPLLDARLAGKRMADRPDLAGMTWKQLMALPSHQRLELDRWYFQPYDLHMTDHGTGIYAEELAKALIKRAHDSTSP